jgi:hypothetical protein
VKVFQSYEVGGGLPVIGGGCSLITHSACSVTTQSIAFKCVMVSEHVQKTCSTGN